MGKFRWLGDVHEVSHFRSRWYHKDTPKVPLANDCVKVSERDLDTWVHPLKFGRRSSNVTNFDDNMKINKYWEESQNG